MDQGPILLQERAPIKNGETRIELEDRLSEISGSLLVQFLPRFHRGEVAAKPQDHNAATYTKKFESNDGLVDFSKDAPETTWRKIRALNPEPGVFTVRNGKRIKLLEAAMEDGKLRITKIQIAGKTPQTISRTEEKNILGI